MGLSFQIPSEFLEIRHIEKGGAAKHRLSLKAFFVDMAEDVVLRSSACHREEELLAAQVPVQVGISWAVGDEKVNIGRDSGWSFQIRPRRNAVELDAVELQPLVLQIDNSSGNQIPRLRRLLVENTVVIAGDEDPELSGKGCVPVEEIL